MLVPVILDRLPALAGRLVASAVCWSPLGRRVLLRIEDAIDDRLVERSYYGVVRGYDPELRGAPLLIQLEDRLRYERERVCRYVDVVATVPALRWHRPERLLITWNAVRVVDAGSFADQCFAATIGTARLLLR